MINADLKKAVVTNLKGWEFRNFHVLCINDFSSPQLQLVGMRMILSKVFLDQFAYWAPVINAIYLFS